MFETTKSSVGNQHTREKWSLDNSIKFALRGQMLPRYNSCKKVLMAKYTVVIKKCLFTFTEWLKGPRRAFGDHLSSFPSPQCRLCKQEADSWTVPRYQLRSDLHSASQPLFHSSLLKLNWATRYQWVTSKHLIWQPCLSGTNVLLPLQCGSARGELSLLCIKYRVLQIFCQSETHPSLDRSLSNPTLAKVTMSGVRVNSWMHQKWMRTPLCPCLTAPVSLSR